MSIEHGNSYYACNRYNEQSSVQARDSVTQSRKLLERYLHYFQRYHNHAQSAKLTEEWYHIAEQKMAEIQASSDLSWIQVQFFRTAVNVLQQCRNVLKWTYAFAYYLKRANHTEIFEDNQRDLELAVEQLNEMLERDTDPHTIQDMRQKIIDKTVYVKSRREVLMADTAQGLLDDRWQYLTEPLPQPRATVLSA